MERLPGAPIRQSANCTKIMMRSILIAAVVGVLAAVPASYFLTASDRYDQVAAPAGGDRSRTVTPAEDWPICSTRSRVATKPSSSRLTMGSAY